MKLLLIGAAVLAGGLAGAGHAQTQRDPQAGTALFSAQEARKPGTARVFSLPTMIDTRPSGAVERQRGFVASVDMGRDLTVGVGFFRMRIKSTTGDGPEAGSKSRKAAIGFSLRF